MAKFSTKFRVRFGDIDQARVMYYPRFFHYFHQAFEEWFVEGLGVTYSDLVIQGNIGFPTVHVETDFRKPLSYGDSMRIDLEVLAVGTKSLTLAYTLVRLPDDVLSVQAKITTVAIDNDSFQAVQIPDVWRDRFEQFRLR